MNKLLLHVGLFTFCGVMGVAGTSQASFGVSRLERNGTAKPPPPVAPATQCNLGLYGAFAAPNDAEMDTYAFSGTCDINVAPRGQTPVVQKVKVQITGEWSPKMKRASELVKVFHTDKTITFSSWATCDKDPYLQGANAKCQNQGLGANDYNYFLRPEDAPFAKNRAPAGWVSTLRARITSRSQLSTYGKISGIERPAAVDAGESVTTSVSFAGGPGSCPMTIDFGDGTPIYQSTLSHSATKTLATHTWSKPGKYTIKAKSLPGCQGDYMAVIDVRTKGGA